MTITTSSRRIFIGCLSCYNNGCICGEWKDLNDFESVDELKAWTYDYLKSNHCETEDFKCEGCDEYEIQDSEGLGNLGNYASLDEAFKRHESIKEFEDNGYDAEVYTAYINEFHEGSFEDFQDRFQGCYNSYEDYVYEYVNDVVFCDAGNNETLMRYFDYQSFGRDLSYDITELYVGNQVYILNNY